MFLVGRGQKLSKFCHIHVFLLIFVTGSEKIHHIAHYMKILVSYIFENLYHKANLPPSLRQIVCFALELERFVYDRAISIENEKLRSEGVAVYAYSISVYYA